VRRVEPDRRVDVVDHVSNVDGCHARTVPRAEPGCVSARTLALQAHATRQSESWRGASKTNRKGGCSHTRPGDPVNILHDIEDRGVATGIDQELMPQVSGPIPPAPLVTEPARLNLSRWRHGFKSRWDYKCKAPGQGTSPEAIGR
jgi:hypothetical protein